MFSTQNKMEKIFLKDAIVLKWYVYVVDSAFI